MEEQTTISPEQTQPPKKKPAFDPNKPFTPVQESKPSFDEKKPFQEVKKKDTDGSVSPSDSSQKQGQTEQRVNTSGSAASKVLMNNYKNNSITPDDLGQRPISPIGPSPEQISHGINNKGKNLDKWQRSSLDNYITSLVNQHKDTQKKLNEAYQRQAMVGDVSESEIKNLSDFESTLRSDIQKSYDARKQKIVPELLDDLKGKVDVSNWADAYGRPDKEIMGVKIKSPLEWNPESHKLTMKSVQWVARNIDDIMNRKGDKVVNAQVSGDLEDKKRTYADLTKSVVDYLNTIPIQKAQQDFTKEYTEKNPHIKDAFTAVKEVNDYFSKANVDAVKAKVNTQRDKEFIKTGDRYYGDNGVFNRNQDYIQIAHKYAQLVHDGTMTDAVARKQIMAEIDKNPSLKKIKDTYESEIKKINENTQKQYQDYLISGLRKEHPKLTIYKDGSVGLADLSEDQYKNMIEGYEEGLDAIAKKMGGEQVAATMKQANEKAKRIGAFWGSAGESINELSSALSKFIFNKTQWGGEKVQYYEAQEIASPSISQSDVAASWNWKGIESLKDPNFWLSKTGSMVPVIAGATAVGLATDGAGMPEYVGWLANAGLFTAQSGLSTYNQLLNTRDAQGNLLTEADASHYMASQMEKDFLPNLLMMAATSGTILRAKNIVKPTIAGTVKKGILGAAEAQPFFTWQGYNDYATMQEAQGKSTDFWDYMQSKEFKDNLINGMVVGSGLSLLHAPGSYMKSVDNWTKMVHTAEGEFKNMIPQNYALGQEMSGNGNYLRDALKLHVFNIDESSLSDEGKRNLSDLRNTLLYSTNLDRNIRTGNLDRTNIQDLYQAHNLALADQHDYLSEQAKELGNKTLAEVYKDKAKDYREQAKAAANGEAKYHYLVNDEGHPIFMSDKSFKVLEKEGTIAQWMKDGTIENVHKSDDPEFAQRYKDFVGAKDEATVEGKDIMDHAAGLIEENKNKLGVYYGSAKENPELFYQTVSDQAFGITRDSEGNPVKSNIPNAEESARNIYGNDIVDLAKVMYPSEVKSEGIKVGDNVQWTSQGTDQFEEPKKVTKISDDGKFAFVEGSNTGIPIDQLAKKGGQNAEEIRGDKGELPKVGEALGTEVQADSGGNLQQTAEAGTEAGDKKNEVAPEDIRKEIDDARLSITPETETIGDTGQIQREKIEPKERKDVGPKLIKNDYDLSKENSSDAEYDIQSGLGFEGNQIFSGYKKIGNALVRIKNHTPDWDYFRDDIENGAKKIVNVTVGDFNNSDYRRSKGELESIKKEYPNVEFIDLKVNEGDSINESIKKIWENIQSPIKTEENEKVNVRGEGEQGNAQSEGEGKGRQEGGAGDKKGNVEPTGGTEGKKPPAPPISEPPKPKGTPKEEFTFNHKKKNEEIEGAKELFEKQKVIPWTENFANALRHVMDAYPEKSWYEALKSHVNHFVGLLDNNILFNPTSRDNAAFLLFKHETLRQMGMIEGWDSPDNLQRQLADIKFNELQSDLFNTVRVTNPGGETGRALQILQAGISGDPQNGLKIRRMELTKAKGAPLTEAELSASAEDWERERASLNKENELKLQAQKEKFDKQIAKLTEQLGKKPEKFNKEKASKVAASLKSFADKVEKFAKPDLPEGTQRMGGPDIQKKVADAIRWIADKIEKGDIRIPDIISSAIEKFKGENDEKELRENIHKGLVEAGVDEKILNNKTIRQTSFDKIKELSELDGSTEITNEMVGKNLIRDYVKSHIGLTDNADIISKATEELKKVLPDVTENQVRKAYLKEDEFRQPTKKELETGLRESERKFNALTKLEKDIADLKEKQTLFKRGGKKDNTPYDKDLLAKEKEKNDIMNSLGVKTSSQDKYTKSSYDLRAKSHNQRLSDLVNDIKSKIEKGDLTSEQKQKLLNLKGKLESSMINLNPNSAESQEKTLNGGLEVLKSVTSEFNRNSEKDITKLGDVRRGLQKVIDGFDRDKSEATQDVKLQKAKDQAKRQMNEFKRKAAAGEFEDNPIVELTKSDAELIKAVRERNKEQQLFEEKKKKFEKQRKDWAKKTGDFLRAVEVGYLIGSPFTLAKVGASALLRPQLEAITKLGYHYTVEQFATGYLKTISERAKLGGESTSIESIKKGYQAYLRQYGEEGLKKLYAEANDKYEKASKAYMDQEKEVERLKYSGMDKPEYKDAAKKLQRLKNEKESALVDAVGNSIYQFIAGSSLKESLEVFLHRSTELERQLGHFDREAWDAKGEGKLVNKKSLADIDNWNYILNGIGRSHAALKNYSARFSFATGFMARLEAYSKEGVDISQPDKLLEIAHESYADWDRGKYQQSNWISDRWNKMVNDVEKRNPEMAYLLRADVAITRVPVNMLHEGIMEYTLGALTGSVIAAKEYYKARKIVLQSNFGPEEQATFKQELSEQLKKMDPKQAAAIVRAYRKGGFGIGMYALFVLGHAAFGGFAHKGQTAEDKKKALREIETGVPEIKTGEIWIGNWKMPNAAAKIIEHTPGFQMPLLGLGLNQVYENSIIDGKSTPESVKDAALAHIEHVVSTIPQAELVGALTSGIVQKVKPSGQWDDVDQDGNPMKRKVFRASDYFAYLHLPGTDGFKKDILSEAYYKQAVSAQRKYREAITEIETNTSLSSKDKEEQRRSLLKELDETIDQIYKENKENPQ